MNKILQKFGGEIAFLNRDEYFNTSVPYSEYVLDDNTIYSPDGTDTGFAYDQQDNEEFYGVVFQDWEGNEDWSVVGSHTDSAFHFAYNQEAGGYSPTDPNNPYNDITNYDPTSDRIDILDLQGYMSVGNTLHGEGVYNGGVIQDLDYQIEVDDRLFAFFDNEAFEAVLDLERNTFNGAPPDADEFAEMFDVERLEDLRNNASAADNAITSRVGKDGWELIGAAGDQYHCEAVGRSSSSCFKFANPDTGQEAVYYDPDPNDGVTEYVLDETAISGGTFNYANGDASSSLPYVGNHNNWDMKPFKIYTKPIFEGSDMPLPSAIPDVGADFSDIEFSSR